MLVTYVFYDKKSDIPLIYSYYVTTYWFFKFCFTVLLYVIIIAKCSCNS